MLSASTSFYAYQTPGIISKIAQKFRASELFLNRLLISLSAHVKNILGYIQTDDTLFIVLTPLRTTK